MAATVVLRHPLRRATYRAVIGLLAVSGMRIGEAIRLDRSDVDWPNGLVVVRASKFGRSREVPLHPATVDALKAYARERDRLQPKPRPASFFVSHVGARLVYRSVCSTFRRLVDTAALDWERASRPPRLHDLRHSFCVQTLVEWYRDDDLDVEALMPRLSTYVGHTKPVWTYWYLEAAPELLGLAAGRLEQRPERAAMTSLAPTLEAFFTDRLINQRQASPNTVTAYRHTFRLLVGFLHDRTGTPPCKLDLGDLDEPAIAAFLEHLENVRRNSVRTRNARLAAIHSFFNYAARHHPEHAGLIQRVLAIPDKRSDAAPSSSSPRTKSTRSWRPRTARPGRAGATRAVGPRRQTGLRAAELTGLTCADVVVGVARTSAAAARAGSIAQRR